MIRRLPLDLQDDCDIEVGLFPELVEDGMEQFAVAETRPQRLADGPDRRQLAAVFTVVPDEVEVVVGKGGIA
jgi:hypothetical protein